MPLSKPLYSKEEFARRGDEIYERDIGPRIGPADEGKFVVIDIKTGEYELDRDELAASGRLLARRLDAQIWTRRVGSRYARRFGPRYGASGAERAEYALSQVADLAGILSGPEDLSVSKDSLRNFGW